EDGIRDKLVTGVQTCALPIYPLVVRSHFKLEVMTYPFRLRIQENFNDVAVPELPSFRLGIFPFIKVQRIVTTGKGKVDMRLCPDRRHTSCSLRIMELPRSIVVKFRPFG